MEQLILSSKKCNVILLEVILMDETLNQNVNVTPQPTPVVTAPSTVVYAGFFRRFLASLIDSILLSIVGFFFGIVLYIVLTLVGFREIPQVIGNIIGGLLYGVYSVYFITQKGQTLGKKAMDLRVQNESTGQNLDVVSAILREVVGKFLSLAVLGLGYFWMLWDDKKQTWHDKIAKSVVVKVK
ncbi:RDD family protein [candidate division WWE3 bacterium CG08_land_8_20_14_0_20_41_10]|uniref:RDD family protein n=1 Tax=candidate division WWE3 bacterium CG08_land_8_20_14_0_20_41_10 TaxID=1975085 RepID=A0A2H0XC04_UNCKA|nr:MAG: RDD family protein [candidate division WWE3 bacterium CG08_land_8_20_14_0_20_41_10]